ncbi:mercuric transport protein MerTP [Reichenbachiella sp.]
MSTSNISSKSASAGLFAAMVASLCCITPVFSLLAGIGGIAATFSWMEPFRPYLIVLTIGILGFAWYQKLKPRTAEEVACACDENQKPSFWQSKKFLGLITAFAVSMLAFPSYSHIFYANEGNSSSSLVFEQDTTKTNKIILEIKGMTCAGCESHIEHEVGLLKGVKSVDAIYSDGSATVEYSPTDLEEKAIIEAINKTGYTVILNAKDQ